MALTLSTDKMKRYRDIAALLIKYGRSDLVARSMQDDILLDADAPDVSPDHARSDGKTADDKAGASPDAKEAEAFADDLERMGPIFIKLGQVLSSRADLLPPAYLAALARLQDNLAPFPFEEVRETIESELGVRLSKAFLEFDPEPIGAASLAQVHRAVLRDGRPVAVKVQRPGIRRQIAEDLDALTDVVELADAHTEMGRRLHVLDILHEFRANLLHELDYRIEAANMKQIGANLAGFDRIVVPSPVDDYSTSRVLTMDYVRGRKVTDLGGLARIEMDVTGLADDLFRAYMKQILVDGLFHADPHPGNVLVTDDGKLALIDLGMVGHVSPGMQTQLLKLLLAIGEGRGDSAADIAIHMGDTSDDFDEPDFRRRVAELVAVQQDATVSQMQIGKALMRFSQLTGESGIRMPAELTMFGKALLNLDEVSRTLDPEFDPNAAIRRHAAEIMRERLLKSVTPGNIAASLMEAQEIVSEMPRRVNRILDLLAKNEVKVRVDAIDEDTLILGFQKVANRIASGLVLAALIIGAAMLMRVQTSFRIFGYPGFAMLCFLAAAGGGFVMLLTIWLADRGRT